jgi:predicted amidophosphoribosyltransferase
MRDRHLPRLCRQCGSPMARQEDACWRCAAKWAVALPVAADQSVSAPVPAKAAA